MSARASDLDHPLARGEPPEWASSWGDDAFGPWASFEVEGVEHRLRWIPPGTSWMGSPEGEAGRWGDEGPRHLMTLTRGFWLGEVPCTQALWRAVTGAQPSAFPGEDRPVEQVSWEDVQAFLVHLAERCPGLEPRLPSEAEWEYACRAGTQTATYAGDLDLRGERDAPVLDAIAWYGGNSGVDYDLEGGVDSSAWPEKQHPHTRAATRRVGTKRPNAWGLHDTLGNVWEWCADGQRAYSAEPVTDPVGPGGADRVIRGGAWSLHARYVRAAYRVADAPSNRDDNLGFRLARGP